MQILAPAFFFLALLGLPVLLLYMLKLRRRDVPVSSTLLWQALLRDRQANAPWQRLKRNLLLFLQLLILAALVFALARPALPVPSVASGSVTVILDASASMNATDASPTRFVRAVQAARQLVSELSPSARMTVIVAGQQPQVLAAQESDKAALDEALDALESQGTGEKRGTMPGMGAANWEAAFALAAGAAAAGAGTGAEAAAPTIVIISDGGLPEGLPPLPGEVRYIPVGESGENLAISGLALRESGGLPELFAQVTNYGTVDRSAVLSLYRGGELFSAQSIAVAAGQKASLVVDGLPAGGAIYEARISSSGGEAGQLDPLPVDDAAFAVYAPQTGRSALLFPSHVQPEVDYNLFLQQALLAVLGEGRSFQARPSPEGALVLPDQPFSLYVFDGLLPDTLPAGNLLLVNPPSSPLLEVTGVFSNTQPATVSEHPLAQFVEWSGVSVLKAQQVRVPAWAQVLVRSAGGPLVFAGETGGRRVAVIPFDLHDSDLPLQVTYPVLMANILNYLAPAQAFEAPEGLSPGESVTIQARPLPDGRPPEQIVIAAPGGKTYAYTPGEDGVTFAETGELGVYAVNALGETTQTADYFAVNLFDPGESRIQPAETIQVGRSTVERSQEAEMGLRELWPWLAGLALVILMVEWWVYHGRQRLPGQRFAFMRTKRGES